MNTLRILHLEDNPRDALLVESILATEELPCEVFNVRTREDYETALAAGRYDLILSDFKLPNYDGFMALNRAKEQHPDIPFIILSGTLGEEQAVESLKRGAADYILKQKCTRFVPAVRRAVEEAHQRLERKRIQDELNRRNDLLQQITNNVEDLIAVLDLEGKRVFNSPSYGQLLGDHQSLAGTDSFDHIHPNDQQRVRKAFRQTVETGSGQSLEYRFVLNDGSIHHIESRGSVIRDSKGKVASVVVVSRDVTDRKAAEQALRDAEARFRNLVEQSIVGICIIRAGWLCYANPKLLEMFGYSPEEMLGRPILEFVAEEDRPLAELRLAERVRGIPLDSAYTIRMCRKDGRIIHVDVFEKLADSRADQPTIMGTLLDVTEKKLLEEKILRSQRLESIGALAGGVSHDLNNVLAPVLMAVDLLRNQVSGEMGGRMLDTIQNCADRGRGMVRQILSFARGTAEKTVTVQLKLLVNDMVHLIKDTFPRSIRIETRIAEDLEPVLGDETQLHQVLLNLLVNSRDAMPGGGIISIQAENVLLEEHSTPSRDLPVSGAFVLLSIADTGTGIPPELKAKIFEPFFTTKELGQGTGLGLSTVVSIIKSHGGFLEVASEVGQGTRFNIYLPVTRQAADQPPQPALIDLPAGRGEQILLVDDELALLQMTKTTLESFNYRVLIANEGAEAVELFQRHRGQIDAVVTDMQMPVMDGPALIRALRAIDSTVKIICASGMGSQENHGGVEKTQVEAFLHKPFTAASLLTTLRQVLA